MENKNDKTVPVFVPKKGQVDYTGIRWSPVINIVITYQGKVLLVQRNPQMELYPGLWNGISGYLDDDKNLEEKVIEELHEELGIAKDNITSITMCDIFDEDDPTYQKTWIVHAVHVQLCTDIIQLDWEAVDHVWIDPSDAVQYKLMPGFYQVLQSVQKTVNTN